MTKLLKPEVYGARLDEPRSGRHIRRLCRAGRIRGAVRPGNEWLIPEGAVIEGVGVRLRNSPSKGLSMREYAALQGVSRQRVHKLLKEHRIEGAKKGKHGWDIPPDAPWPADEF